MLPLLFVCAGLAQATTVSETRLESPKPEIKAGFGHAIHLSGDDAIVGEPYHDAYGSDAGMAWIHTYDGSVWNEVELHHPGIARGDKFGIDVAVHGDWAVVGARSANHSEGAVYLFERNTGGPNNWGYVQMLTNPLANPHDSFGESVDIEGGLLVVGAYRSDWAGSNAGAAFVFEQSGGTWSLVTQLVPGTTAISDQFGKSCAVSGGVVACGAPFNDKVHTNNGMVFVFEENAGGPGVWGETAAVYGPTQPNTHFGWSVDLHGPILAVGAPEDGATQEGAVYTFDGPSGWGLQDVLVASDAWQNDQFGTAVALHDDWLLVGAPYEDDNGNDAGAAYLFEYDGALWFQEQKLLASTSGDAGDQFGQDVAIDAFWAGTGVPNNSESSMSGSGSIYLFGLPSECDVDLGSSTLQEAATPAAMGYFGYSVAADGSTSLVSEMYDDRVTVYELELGSWVVQTELLLPAGYGPSWFGYDMDIEGDTAVIGAHRADTWAGAAFVFERNLGGPDNWGLAATLTAWDGAPYDHFGRTVGVSGDTVVVGALWHDDLGVMEAGSAYVFDRNTGGLDAWGLETQLWASDAGAAHLFGWACDVYGDTIACSAPQNTYNGAGYVFERAGYGSWPEVFKYTHGYATHLGDSVSVADDLIVWGAPRTGNYRGSVFAIEHTLSWAHYQEILPPVLDPRQWFGASISLDDHTLLAGAKGYEESAAWAYTGGAFLYEDDAVAFTHVDTTTPPLTQHRIWFGHSVALTCGQAVVGGHGWETASGLYRAGGVWHHQ